VHVPHRETLCRGLVLPNRRRSYRWSPHAVLAHIAEGVSNFWVLDLSHLGPLLRARASPMASPAFSTPSGGLSGWFRAKLVRGTPRAGARGSTHHRLCCFFFNCCCYYYYLFIGYFIFLYFGFVLFWLQSARVLGLVVVF
jgi:hypothetical protein